MGLYFKYLKIQLKTNMSYRASLWFTMIGQVLINIGTLIGFYFLFEKFNILAGYTFKEILLTYAIVLFVFSFDEMMFRGFDEFDTLVGTGKLDQMLLRPRNLVLQICGHKIELVKLGRVLMSSVLIIVACTMLPVVWTVGKILVLIEMILSGIITYFGVYLLTSSITIFTIKKAEFINVFTDGGRELTSYPLDVFKKGITKFFTFVIPFASYNFIPLHFILGYANSSIWNVIYPLVSIIFALIGYLVFNFCMKFYKSAG